MNNEEKILEMLVEMRSDIRQINGRLDHLETKVDEIDQRSERTQVLLETDYADKLQLLFEGHTTILETLAPKSRVEALEDDVSFMKTVIKALSQEIAELKKAQ